MLCTLALKSGYHLDLKEKQHIDPNNIIMINIHVIVNDYIKQCTNVYCDFSLIRMFARSNFNMYIDLSNPIKTKVFFFSQKDNSFVIANAVDIFSWSGPLCHTIPT